MLAAHMGNCALLATHLAFSGLPVSVVYRRARMMSAGFFERGLPLYGIEGISANAGIQAYGRMLDALRRGRILFVMMDQGTKAAQDGIICAFSARTCPSPLGPPSWCVIPAHHFSSYRRLPRSPSGDSRLKRRRRARLRHRWNPTSSFWPVSRSNGSCSIRICGAGISGAGANIRWSSSSSYRRRDDRTESTRRIGPCAVARGGSARCRHRCQRIHRTASGTGPHALRLESAPVAAA